MNLDLSLIKTDGGTQTRAMLDMTAIAEYAEAMQDGAKFPPITVFYDGSEYWLADGFHRVAAATSIGVTTIDADVKQGTRRDAILYSVGSNALHGIRRTNADKRRAVETLLNDSEWNRWSDREIARRCFVVHAFVNKLRQELSVHCEQIETPRLATRNGTTYTMDTSNIGRGVIPIYGNLRDYQESFTPSPPVALFEPEPPMPEPPVISKPYHAGNRSVSDQFHSKLIWNYQAVPIHQFGVFTIGYSQRSIEQFLSLLEVAHVTTLVDVRRNPVSQYKPEFSKTPLDEACERAGVRYVHIPELGVDYEDRADLHETHDYDALFDAYETRLTLPGILQLVGKRINLEKERPAFMCVELDPNTCHRSRIVKAFREINQVEVIDL